MRVAIETGEGPTIVCAQAGEVNTGAFEDFHAIADLCEEHGCWLHVDGAFGLWAAASRRFRHLTAGVERADSWATDGHKWLNVPYDCGIAFCAHPAAHRAAMRATASYLLQVDESEAREPMAYTPEFSRRARAVPVYAALRQLGRSGIAELVERCCDAAAALASGLARIPGCTVLNEVVLNQVLVRLDADERTTAALAAFQADGEAWTSGTVWEGHPAIRFSVSSWRTTPDDVERSIAAFARAAASCSATLHHADRSHERATTWARLSDTRRRLTQRHPPRRAVTSLCPLRAKLGQPGCSRRERQSPAPQGRRTPDALGRSDCTIVWCGRPRRPEGVARERVRGAWTAVVSSSVSARSFCA